MSRTAIERFEDKIFYSPDGCWYWIAQVSIGKWPSHIRPKMKVGLRPMLAYRFAYQHFKGSIPSGLCVLHSCDNPICVNPDHLFLGTRMDNTLDMLAKKRKPVGERHYKSKLTDIQVCDILRSTEANKVLSQKYGVSLKFISAVRCRTTYKHITDLKAHLEQLTT